MTVTIFLVSLMGAMAIGVANLGLCWVLMCTTGYPVFIVPNLLIGAGFVIATTVRTAIIFASVPKDLPASAAELDLEQRGHARHPLGAADRIHREQAPDMEFRAVLRAPAGRGAHQYNGKCRKSAVPIAHRLYVLPVTGTNTRTPVSYTHLTLPTIYPVEISVVAV